MFRYRCQLRRWSARLLLLWFFGIASSFANACVIASQPGSAAQPGADSVAVHAPERQHEATASHDLQPSPGVNDHCSAGKGPASLKTNCEDFCDKSTISIPPLKLAVDHSDASAAHPPVAILFATEPPGPAHRQLPRQDGGLAPPCAITIAFLRLAL